jgi:hypothetical protein
MAIKTNELNQPERGMALGNREAGNEYQTEMEKLRARIEGAKKHAAMTQAKSRLANRFKCECFERGWMAAVTEIEKGSGV